MSHRLKVFPDAAAAAAAGAHLIADSFRHSVATHGSFAFAVSGGSTPWSMFELLRGFDLPWNLLTLYQVDERVGPRGDPQRNLTHLRSTFAGLGVRIAAMPVDEADLDEAARTYERLLPAAFDLVHLGLGADGHTASLVPGDRVLDVVERGVAITASPYAGRRRMTLTFPALATARATLWLVTGADKRQALAGLLRGDRELPAARVQTADSVVLADADAAGL